MKKNDPNGLSAYLDLTTLKSDSDEVTVLAVCEQAVKAVPHCAAVCVPPGFVALAAKTLRDVNVRVATVANFPEGCDDQTDVVAAIKAAVSDGADEIDVVFDACDYRVGKTREPVDAIAAYKEACQGRLLKVIVESAAWKNKHNLLEACVALLAQGADFLKTSTGFSFYGGATLADAQVLSQAIAQHHTATGRWAGLKVSGGIRTVEQADAYRQLAESLYGDRCTPALFRIGASQML